MKKCVKCGKEKSEDKFYKTSRKGGLTSLCRDCHSVTLKKCVVCNKEFEGKRGKILCSKECRLKYRPQTFKTCIYCGKVYGPVDRINRKFCSLKCKSDSQKGKESKMKGMKRPNLYTKEDRTCETCGKKFRAVGDFGIRQQIYCSHRCYLKNRRVSHFESMVKDYLISLKIPIEEQIRVKRWCFDFRIKDTNIFIEADGSYWHSSPKTIERDKRKNEWCASNGHELYRIDELSFYKDKQAECDVLVSRWERLAGQPAVRVP